MAEPKRRKKAAGFKADATAFDVLQRAALPALSWGVPALDARVLRGGALVELTGSLPWLVSEVMVSISRPMPDDVLGAGQHGSAIAHIGLWLR